MKKFAIISLFVLSMLLLATNVYAQTADAELQFDGTAITTDPFKVDVESGEDSNRLTLTVINTGAVTLNNVQVFAVFDTNSDGVFQPATDISTTKEDNDDDSVLIINPSSTSIPTLNPTLTSSPVTITFDVEQGFDVGTLKGFLVISSLDLPASLYYNLDLDVKPLACQPNADEGDLDINLDQPDDGDEIESGDIISVNVEVDNTGDDDIDTKLKAVLYNKDNSRKIATKTVSKNIDDGDEEEIRFDLDSGDTDDLEEDDDVALFIKVFDEDNEDVTCVLEEIDLEVQVPDHKIVVNDLTMGPLSARCNDQISGTAHLKNVGDNDENVVFEISNPQLGIIEALPSFILDELGSRDDEEDVSFSFNIPDNAEAGVYQIFAKAKYSGQSDFASQEMTILNCDEDEETNTGSSNAGSTETSNTGAGSTDTNTQTGTISNPPVQAPATSTGAVTFTDKDIFDAFEDKSLKIPSLVWILIDVLLVLLIIGVLVWIFRPR